jgi:hypothetical protein
MNFNKFLKISIVFLLVFCWVFSEGVRIWQKPKVASAQLTEETQLSEEEQSSENSDTLDEEGVSLSVAVIEELQVAQTEPLKERKVEKIVNLDKDAYHKCNIEPFQIDISNRQTAFVHILLEKGKIQGSEEIEIGSLPIGIDLLFSKNEDYLYRPQIDESSLDVEITNQPGSQKGNFSIPIIYTSGNSTTICQINIINL